MAFSKTFVACLFLLVIAARLVESDEILESGGRSLLSSIDCAAKCEVRCSKSWKPKMCHKTCETCCHRCNCVPSGTSMETRSECPCYAQMKTHGNRLKCP
ncbi:gibberellin-regulated protein 1-like [Asparagus officinalis]|uniref:gibberellin-regulated protein 1-like n=1 Tax=Asparagus officinalis TaxID=4686 RepID=UPI00098E4C70|nr:gibberellin-regulated protein 1-like [Asparagus officinalis]